MKRRKQHDARITKAQHEMLKQAAAGHRDAGGHPLYAETICLPTWILARGAARIAMARRLRRRGLLKGGWIALQFDGGLLFQLTARGAKLAAEVQP